MKIIDIAFTNYKILQRCHVKLTQGITFFIGRNNSGKSSVIEGLSSVLETTTKNRRQSKLDLNMSKNSVEGEISIRIELDKVDLTEIQKQNQQGLEIDLSDTYYLEKKIRFNKSGVFVVDVKLKVDNTLVLNDVDYSPSFVWIKSYTRPPSREQVVSNIDLFENENNNLIRNYVYYLSQDQNKFTKLKRIMKDLFPKYEIYEPSIKQDYDLKLFLRFGVYGSNHEIEIESMGDGFKNALIILARIILSDSKIIMIDEPEIGMHTELMKKFIAIINKYFNKKQIIICSHNENLINYFPDKNIKYVFQNNPISSEIVPLSIEYVNKLLEDLGVCRSNFQKSKIIQSKLIIFIEGNEDEERYITKLLSKINPEFESLNISFESTNGGGLISQDLKLIDKINGSPLTFVLIRDRDELNEETIQKAEQRLGDRLHIWKLSEIENYWFDYDTILNLIKEKVSKKQQQEPNEEHITSWNKSDLANKVLQLSEIYKTKTIISHIIKNYRIITVFDRSEISKYEKGSVEAFMDAYINDCTDKISGIKQYIENVERIISSKWNVLEVSQICPGKDLFSELNKWLQEELHIDINHDEVLDKIPKDNIDEDVLKLNDKIYRLYPTLDPRPFGDVKLQLKLDPSISYSSDRSVISIS